MSSSEIITLNVGGVLYTTTRATLITYPESMLGAMFSSDMEPTNRDTNGHYFIDRDGSVFKYVLNFLRSNTLSLPKDFDNFSLLIAEADYYQIQALIEEIKRLQIEKSHPKPVHLEPGDFLEIHTLHEKRFSGSNLRNSDGTTAHFAVETIHLILCGKTQHIDEYMKILMMKGSNPLGEGEEYFIESDPGKFSSTMIFKKYNQFNMTKFRHIHQEHRGIIVNMKLRLNDHLSQNGWKLMDSGSVSGTYGNKEVNSDIFCSEYRERWYKASTVSNVNCLTNCD